jgi:hypothetical protein
MPANIKIIVRKVNGRAGFKLPVKRRYVMKSPVRIPPIRSNVPKIPNTTIGFSKNKNARCVNDVFLNLNFDVPF